MYAVAALPALAGDGVGGCGGLVVGVGEWGGRCGWCCGLGGGFDVSELGGVGVSGPGGWCWCGRSLVVLV